MSSQETYCQLMMLAAWHAKASEQTSAKHAVNESSCAHHGTDLSHVAEQKSFECVMQLPVNVLHGGLTTYSGLNSKFPELLRYAQSSECKVVVPGQMIQMLASQTTSNMEHRTD